MVRVLDQLLVQLQGQVSNWPDADHGLRVDDLGPADHPDALAAIVAAKVREARQALGALDAALTAAWSTAGRLHVD
ncbi:hypothetical protein MLGJGCBP_00259 [Rhodococcus sp. T7]|nr:hypothetical protein MLGJGCBP_00259 [Rhodococcus sp. T7]